MDAPWYRDGLRFNCTGCGHCCTGAPGYVWVGSKEIDRLAQHLGLSREDFGRRYLRRVKERYSLLERRNGDCVFWREGVGCTVYSARPSQCRSFPFWPEHLRTPAAWQELRSACPGAGEGRIYPLEEIQLIRRGKEDAGGT